MSPKKFNPFTVLVSAAALLAIAGCNTSAPPPLRPAAPASMGNGASGPIQLPPRPPGSPPLPKCQEGMMGDCTK
jgi:hypothetical protein